MHDIFMFSHDHELEPRRLPQLLGGKGANLAEMTSVLGLPVPPGFTIATHVGRAYTGGQWSNDAWPAGLSEQIDAAMGRLKRATGCRFGDPALPLVVSVRSGAEVSMPGMLRSVLNVGVTSDVLDGLADTSGGERVAARRFALDTFRRGIAALAGAQAGQESGGFEQIMADARARDGVANNSELSTSSLEFVVEASLGRYAALIGRPFPQDPSEQLRLAITSVLDSWSSPEATAYRLHQGIDDSLGTAVNVQEMVYGNRGVASGSGVVFTRHPVTGTPGLHGDFLPATQGEAVVGGTHDPLAVTAMRDHCPGALDELVRAARRLEVHYRDMLDIEFTVDDGTLWLLQTRVGSRSAAAAARIAVDLHDDPEIVLTPSEATARVLDTHPEVLRDDIVASGTGAPLCHGLAASPGVATGRVCFTSDEAITASEQGNAVILVRSATSPSDVAGLDAADGILTTTGGIASHAAVVARGWAKPAVVGASAITIDGDAFHVGDVAVRAGEHISIDGTTGAVHLGALDTEAAVPTPEVMRLRAWAAAEAP